MPDELSLLQKSLHADVKKPARGGLVTIYFLDAVYGVVEAVYQSGVDVVAETGCAALLQVVSDIGQQSNYCAE